MAYQNEDVCHFRHCARIYSAATNQGLMYLTAEVSGTQFNYYPTGRLLCTLVQNEWKNQRFWLLTDRPGEPAGNAGIGYLADVFTSTSISTDFTFFHNFGCSSSSGAQPTADHSSPNSYDSDEQWVFIPDGDAIVIMKPNTQLCLTAGSSPSNSISSSSVSCYLTTWGGYANQRWILMDPLELCNIYQMAPILDPALCIATPGQVTQDKAALGIEAYDETDTSATWMGWYDVDGSYGFFAQKLHLSRPTTPQDLAYDLIDVETSLPEAGARLNQKCISYPQSGLFVVDSEIQPLYMRQYTDDVYVTSTGNYFGHQYAADGTKEESLSSSDGTLAIAASPYTQTISTSTKIANAPQYWLNLPRNFYNSGLPTPYDLQIVCHDNSTGDEWLLSPTDEVPAGHSLTLTPRFICDWEQFSAVCRIRFKDQSSRIAGESWDEWDIILSPTNSNYESLREAPWAIPDGPEAWVPNSWATTVDSDGYRTLTRGFELTGLFDQHAGQVAQISITVKAFGYGREHYYPWAPYTGAGATFTTLIAEKPDITLSAPCISDDGVHWSYSVSNFPGANQLSISFDGMRATYIHSGVTEYLTAFLAEPYEIDLVESSGEVVIPMENFDGEAMLTLIDALTAGDSVTVDISRATRLISQYDTQTIVMYPETITMESGATQSSASLYASEIGQWTTSYTNINVSYTWCSSYQLTATERGTRLRKLDNLGPGQLRFARHLTGLTWGPGDSPHIALLCRRDSNNSLLYQVRRDSGTASIIVASLSWIDHWDVMHIIPVEGSLSYDVSSKRNLESAQRRGSQHYLVSTDGGATPTLKFSGVLYKGELAAIPATSSSQWVVIDTDLSDIYRIPSDADVWLRSTYGTAYMARISRIESPRSNSQMTPITIEMMEVE